MGDNQVIKAPVSEVVLNTPNPTIELTDYPFEILLDTAPSDEILELIYGEGLSNLPEVETTDAEIFAKLLLWSSRPAFLYAGLKLRNKEVDGKKLQKYRIRCFLNYLAN
ncbi:MAG: hypothetical protein ABEJ99_03120 [Candidatus Nanohaloarchaea archaeon]